MILLLYLGGDIISRLSLKIIALITMIIDHIGSLLFPEITILRIIGRLAFPLYCFLLVDGYEHIKNDKKRLAKYAINLLLFAIISEVPFNLMQNHTCSYILHQNVLFELFVGLLMLIGVDFAKDNRLLKTIFVYLASIFAFALFFDYSFFGVLLILGLYYYRKSDKNSILYISFLIFIILFIVYDLLATYTPDVSNYWANSLAEDIYLIGVPFAIPLILSYNGSQGKHNRFIKYFFYFSYPLHIIILLFIEKII